MSRAQSKLLVLSVLTVARYCTPGYAAPVPDLYVAQAPAMALSGPALDEAFALALDQVLVKVTGQRSVATDPVRWRSVGPAGPLVRQYQPLAGGQVRVSFSPAALRRRLDASNLPVWADDRPRTLVILPGDVSGSSAPQPGGDTAAAGPGDPTSGVASGVAGWPLGSPRQVLLATAASRGVELVFAPEAAVGAPETEQWLLDPEATARSAGADLLLVGRIAPSGGPALMRWTLIQDNERAEWQGDAAEGANGLADRLAARYATAAAATRVLRLRIEGVNNFDDYGRLQSYLRTVGLLQSTELQSVTGGALIFAMDVRGDVAQLNDALALQRVLEPVPDSGTGDLVYRLAPYTWVAP